MTITWLLITVKVLIDQYRLTIADFLDQIFFYVGMCIMKKV